MSSYLVISSSMSILGFRINAHASANRFRSPPDKPVTCRPPVKAPPIRRECMRSCPNPTSVSTCCTSDAEKPSRPCRILATNSTASWTVCTGKKAKSCGTKATAWRSKLGVVVSVVAGTTASFDVPGGLVHVCNGLAKNRYRTINLSHFFSSNQDMQERGLASTTTQVCVCVCVCV